MEPTTSSPIPAYSYSLPRVTVKQELIDIQTTVVEYEYDVEGRFFDGESRWCWLKGHEYRG